MSTTLFSFHTNTSQIIYARYHRDKSFQFERVVHEISDIQERHYNLIIKYLNIIIVKLKELLNCFYLKLEEINGLININDIDTSLKCIEDKYELFFEYKYGYDKCSVYKIYELKNKHSRYQNFIDEFFEDLNTSLYEMKKDILENFNDDDLPKTNNNPQILQPIKIEIKNFSEDKSEYNIKKNNFNYEIGKLGKPKNFSEFMLYGNLLKSICQGQLVVLDELDNMEKNFDNTIEYYTSYRLICKQLNVK